MSVHVASWAWKQKVGDAGAKLLLIKLAEQANDRGECWPSQKRLADECEMSRRTVQRKLEMLYEGGFVRAEPRARDDGGDTSLLYRLGPVQAATAPEPVPVRQPDAPPSVTDDAPPAPLVTHHEPSEEPTSPAEAGEGDAPSAPRPRDEVWDTLEERFGRVEPKTNAHAKRNKAAADLRRLAATSDSIRHALDRWPFTFPGATLTDVALATHYPQLTAGYTPRPTHDEHNEPAAAGDSGIARARLRNTASAAIAAIHRQTCPECEASGGRHLVGCTTSLRETTTQAYRRFVEESAADPTFELADLFAVIDEWRDIDDVDLQEFHDLADRVRAGVTTTTEERAA